MGRTCLTTVTCDKCTMNQTQLDTPDSPLPDGWMLDQGYANVFSGIIAGLLGYYCPTCIATYGTRALVKYSADLCGDLTDPT